MTGWLIGGWLAASPAVALLVGRVIATAEARRPRPTTTRALDRAA